MAKSPTKHQRPVATARDRAPKAPQAASITEHDIARHAYDLFLARGGEHGHDVEDWLRAQRELKNAERIVAV